MSNKVNATTLSNFQDSARIYKWDLEINFGGLPSETINLRATTTSVPTPDFNIIETEIRGFTKKESGAVSWNEITITPIEVQDYTIFQALTNLGTQQFDYESGVQQSKNSYTGKTKIMMQNLQDSVVGTWVLHGCLISTYEQPEMSGEKGSAVEMPFTVHYDYATVA